MSDKAMFLDHRVPTEVGEKLGIMATERIEELREELKVELMPYHRGEIQVDVSIMVKFRPAREEL